MHVRILVKLAARVCIRPIVCHETKGRLMMVLV